MKSYRLLLLLLVLPFQLFTAEIRVKYVFNDPSISTHESFHLVQFENTLVSGLHGEPMLPYQSVSILLPPGEEAVEIEIIYQDEQELPGYFVLMPRQYASPISMGSSGEFLMNRDVYDSQTEYPQKQNGVLNTCFLNGHAIAITSFTPVKYLPAQGKIRWYRTAEVIITTQPLIKASEVLANLSDRESVKNTVSAMVSNPEMLNQYPKAGKRNTTDMLIITPESFKPAFNTLRTWYEGQDITSEIISPSEIAALMPGIDLQEKIRNYIIQRYQLDDIKYVLLGGDVEHVPYRGFYCQVQSSSVYEDDDIPSDLYYASLDGSWNSNGNNRWGEPGEDDLLPELAVARLTFSNLTEQSNMLNKVYKYQAEPVIDELENNLLAGEHLYSSPLTWGGDYLDLLIGYQNENGYITEGIPPSTSNEKMYDRDLGYWSGSQIIQKINTGKTIIHHSGHSNWDYTMRLDNSDITNANFSNVNGVDHNYSILYSHGCICGAFDYNDCIGEKMLKIQNFAVAIAFNSRYGWFNEGQTEGPSAHLHREFVHSLYTLGYDRIGETQQHSKIRTAPWVTAPGQWEEGALRWCFYAHNILGDPAMTIHRQNLPAIVVNPNEFFVQLMAGESSTLELTIGNIGNTGINFFLTAEELNKEIEGEDNMKNTQQKLVDWLVFNSNPGSVQPGQTFTALIEVNTSNLSIGSYYANIIVNNSDPLNPLIAVPVWLQVSQAAITPGDANCDGNINVLDVITIVNYIVGYNPQPFCFENADINNDGIVNVLDAIANVTLILGKS